MGAVWYRARADLRSGWRGLVVIGILAGLFFGAVAASAAAAQRTETVVARTLRITQPPDVFMIPEFTRNGATLKFDVMSKWPEVADSLKLIVFPTDTAQITASPATAVGVFKRISKLIQGRAPDPNAADEATVSFKYRDRFHTHVGDIISATLPRAGLDLNDPKPGPSGPTVHLKVVGIEATLGDVASAADPEINVGPAFLARYGGRATGFHLYAFRLHRGPADLPAFRDRLRVLTRGAPVLSSEAQADNQQVQRSFHLQAVVLWILAASVALVALLVISQVVYRRSAMYADDDRVLGSLGVSARQRAGIAGVRALAIGSVGAVVATVLAILVSPLAPFGTARLVEPSPGFAYAWLTIGATVAVVVLVCVVSSVAAAWLAARRRRAAADATASRRALARLGNAVVPGVGVRFALDPGKGRSSVPVRSTITGCCIGIVAVVMALTVGRSLDHMIASPRLYGWSYDARVEASTDFGTEDRRNAVRSIPGVTGASFGGAGAPLILDRVQTDGFFMRSGDSEVGPVVTDGRRPVADDEIAVGRKTLGAIHKKIGERLQLSIQGVDGQWPMRIVGIVVLPLNSDNGTLGEGAFVTWEALHDRLPIVPVDNAFVRVDPSMRASVLAKLSSLGQLDLPEKPATVIDFGHVRSMPLVLAGVLALLAVGTIAHLLATSIGRRRRDLAILKTIGFVKKQVGGAVAWQAATLAVACSIVALPAGIALGRWAWTAFARYGGFVSSPVVSWRDTIIVAGATIVVSQLVAALPARAAARTQPALVLRSE